MTHTMSDLRENTNVPEVERKIGLLSKIA